MPRIKQSATGWSFIREGLTAEDFIKGAAEIGLSAVELIDQKYWPLAQELGLKIATFAGHNTLTDGLNRRENHDRIEQELLANIELAAENGIPGIICFSGNRYDGLSDAEGIDITAEGLSRVTKAAEEKGINLCLELLNSKVDHPDYQCDRTAWGVEVCKRVNSPRMKLLYDIYHMQIMEGDIIRTIQENIEYIGHVHTAGNPGRHDLDETQEIYYPPIMQTIVETGYDLYVGHEFIPKGDPIEGLKAAFKLCDVG
ncbi:MAG: TIM barrel protein [Candidatus Poribacteria bacterium]|nr:TIM barrel protein [Candidatus Poribacteria bacterium]